MIIVRLDIIDPNRMQSALRFKGCEKPFRLYRVCTLVLTDMAFEMRSKNITSYYRFEISDIKDRAVWKNPFRIGYLKVSFSFLLVRCDVVSACVQAFDL